MRSFFLSLLDVFLDGLVGSGFGKSGSFDSLLIGQFFLVSFLGFFHGFGV